MSASRKLVTACAAVAALAVVAANTVYIVDQRQQAVVLNLATPVRVVNGPNRAEAGLKFKLPFVENVIFLDKRIQPLLAQPQPVTAVDQAQLDVQALMRFRITDPGRFYLALGDPHAADVRLSGMLNTSLRQVLGRGRLRDIVADRRDQFMQQARADLERRAEAGRWGLEVVDVRLARLDLPTGDAQAVIRRMIAEQEQQAVQIRTRGDQQKREIIGDADRDAAIAHGAAIDQAEQIHGQGEAQRAAIYAAAYGQDPGFAKFYRTLQAYDRALGKGDTTFVLSPQSAFLSTFEVGPHASK